MELEAKIALIKDTKWYHTFEILPGVWTDGARGYKVDVAARLNNANIPQDLSGQTVLDIGTFDGMYAFELERRGATVYALDIQDPDAVAFNRAKRILASRVTHVRGSVYDLNSLGLPKFDLVLFFGVFYHLKHPVLAFRRIREQLRDGGLIHFDGVVLDTIWVKKGKFEEHREAIEAIRHLPVCYYTDPDRISWNWSFPTVKCLHEWLVTTGYDEPTIKFYEQSSGVVGWAKAAPRTEIPVEHSLSSANASPKASPDNSDEHY